MTQSILLSGVGRSQLLEKIRDALLDVRPAAIGIASAFVSVQGMKRALDLATECGAGDCRIIAGISGEITHPNAFKIAQRAGWGARIGRSPGGIFHPKFIVGGSGFSPDGKVLDPTFVYVGSGNLGRAGLELNLECSILATWDGCFAGADTVFQEVWTGGEQLTDEWLDDYSRAFADRSRQRSMSEMGNLGLLDSGDLDAIRAGSRVVGEVPEEPAVDTAYAVGAWAGLESFTGDYTFQLEFPRAAAEVLFRIVRPQEADGRIIVEGDDALQREMTYQYYPKNGMFRLNIPNDVPGVDRARESRSGIALVSSSAQAGVVSLRFFQPGDEMDEVVGRSFLLGTWGKTSTRLYGWF